MHTEICAQSDHLGPALHCTSHEIRRELDARIAARIDPELTGMRGLALNYIVRCNALGGDVYQRDIETRFHIRRSSVTALLQGMEQSGLITRCPVAQDARLKKLVATPRGQDCCRRIVAEIDRFEAQLRRGLDDADIAQFHAVLQKLLDNLHGMEKERGQEET